MQDPNKDRKLKGFHQKLPVKICVTCQQPFNWRKKWEKNWENVKYCSKKCSKKR